MQKFRRRGKKSSPLPHVLEWKEVTRRTSMLSSRFVPSPVPEPPCVQSRCVAGGRRYRNQASLLEVRMGSVFTGRYRGFRRDVADGGRVRTGLVRRGRLLARPSCSGSQAWLASASRSSQADRPIRWRRGEGKAMFATWMCLSMQTDARSITSREKIKECESTKIRCSLRLRLQRDPVIKLAFTQTQYF